MESLRGMMIFLIQYDKILINKYNKSIIINNLTREL